MVRQEQETDVMVLQKEADVILLVFQVFSAVIVVYGPELLYIFKPGQTAIYQEKLLRFREL
jgi:hypothetical protein